MLKEFKVDVYGYDPYLSEKEIEEFDVKPTTTTKGFDCLIITVGHDQFRELYIDNLTDQTDGKTVVVDVRGIFDQEQIEHQDIWYEKL